MALPPPPWSRVQQVGLPPGSKKTSAATWITKRVGSSYTASCYTNLYSLFATIGEGMVGKRVVVYSYGSGSASTMYRLRVDRLPTFDRDVFQRCGTAWAKRTPNLPPPQTRG